MDAEYAQKWARGGGTVQTWEQSSVAARLKAAEYLTGIGPRGVTALQRQELINYVRCVKRGDDAGEERLSKTISDHWYRACSNPIARAMTWNGINRASDFLRDKLDEDYRSCIGVRYDPETLLEMQVETSNGPTVGVLELNLDPVHTSRRIKAVKARGGACANDLRPIIRRGDWDTLAVWIKGDQQLVDNLAFSKKGAARMKAAIARVERKYFPPHRSALSSRVRSAIGSIGLVHHDEARKQDDGAPKQDDGAPKQDDGAPKQDDDEPQVVDVEDYDKRERR